MYYDKDTIIYLDNEFIKAADAKADIYSQSLHYGYAVFEGIRAYNTHNGVKIFKATEHFERMKFSCEAVGIPYPFDNNELIDLSYQVLEKNNLKDAYIRPLVFCAPNMSLSKAKSSQLMIAAWNWSLYLGDKLVDVMTSSFQRISPKSFKVQAKVSGHYVNSIMASQEAKDCGYDEALLLDINGNVAEGPGANFFMEKDGSLYTPKLGSILPGITRATVIEICNCFDIEVVEKEIKPAEVFEADSAFFCGTAAEIIGIASLDKVVFPKNWRETIGSTIQKAYKELVLETSNKTGIRISIMELNKYSKTITQDVTQPGAQAMLYAIGFKDEDFDKAQVGIVSMGWDGNPCNMHLNDLATSVRKSVNDIDGLLGLRFYTIGVSDGISMGTDGMRYSLVSRDLIADSIETNAGAQYYDSIIAIPGCDKNMPGCIMAMGRLNRPSIMLYGGTIAPGHYKGEDLNLVSAFEALGQKNCRQLKRGGF